MDTHIQKMLQNKIIGNAKRISTKKWLQKKITNQKKIFKYFMKISILLPYKENFSPIYPGAVSIFINDTLNHSKLKNNITVFGSTNYKKKFNHKYINLKPKNVLLQSQNKKYVYEFKKYELRKNSDLIEIHNRPSYIRYLGDLVSKTKLILYFHNDPLMMNGSKYVYQRKYLLDKCSKIVFNSNWSKNRFLKKLSIDAHSKNKICIWLFFVVRIF